MSGLLLKTLSQLQQWPHHHPDGVWWTHWIWMLVWIALIIVLVAALIRAASNRGRPPRESARNVLERRYAQGESSTEEYQERRTHLERSPHHHA